MRKELTPAPEFGVRAVAADASSAAAARQAGSASIAATTLAEVDPSMLTRAGGGGEAGVLDDTTFTRPANGSAGVSSDRVLAAMPERPALRFDC